MNNEFAGLRIAGNKQYEGEFELQVSTVPPSEGYNDASVKFTIISLSTCGVRYMDISQGDANELGKWLLQYTCKNEEYYIDDDEHLPEYERIHNGQILSDDRLRWLGARRKVFYEEEETRALAQEVQRLRRFVSDILEYGDDIAWVRKLIGDHGMWLYDKYNRDHPQK